MMRTGRIAARIGGAAFALLLVFALTDPGASQALAGGTSGQMPDEMKQKAVEAYGKLPVRFEANRGQIGREVDFLARGSGYTVYLTGTEAVLVMRQGQGNRPGVLRMKFVGANPAPRVAGVEQLPGTANYFVGNDPRAWRTGIPTYAKVEYRDVYPGVNLVYYGNQGQLEYDFVVAPGADPEAIRLGFSGTDRLEIDARGDLVIHTVAGVIRQHKPVLYQEVNGVRREVSGGYVLKGRDQIAFHVAGYDASRPLVIDPVLSYSTFLGGQLEDIGFGIAVDKDGNVYVTGRTFSGDLATLGALDNICGGVYTCDPTTGTGRSDAFVTKFDRNGTLIYFTYLGGDGDDVGQAIAVDSGGNAYVTGFTSGDFPTFPMPGAYDATFNGPDSGLDAFVAKLNAVGSGLVYSTYLGGRGLDDGKAIAVDSGGNAYVTGFTASADFPTFPMPGAFDPTYNGPNSLGDAYVAKLNAAGSALEYSTFLGGNDGDAGTGIAVDSGGNAYVTGETTSTNFPTTAGASQTTNRGDYDAFVTKLNSTGSGAVYSTYLGGSGKDKARGIALDDNGYAYVTGFTFSTTNFPTVGAFDATCGTDGNGSCNRGFSGASFSDAFVTKLTPTGGVEYSTYLGGGGDDVGEAIAVDSDRNAYVTGRTDSSDFPTLDPLVCVALNEENCGVRGDAFVTKLNPSGSALRFSTYLGGGGDDAGTGIALHAAGNALYVHVTGHTLSLNFPTAGTPALATLSGDSGDDAFVAKIEIPNPEIPVPKGCPVDCKFGAFSLRELELDRDDDDFDHDAFKARFTLGDGSDGIKPLTEDVTIQVGSASVTIPAGSFTMDRKGQFKYKGTLGGVKVKVSIRQLDADSFKLTFKGEEADKYRHRGRDQRYGDLRRRDDRLRGDLRRRHDDRYEDIPFWWSKHRPGRSSDITVTIGNDHGEAKWSPKGGQRGERDRDGDRGDDRDNHRNDHRGRRR